MEKIGAFSPENAKMVLEVVRYLRANGMVIKGGQKKDQLSPVDQANPPLYFRNDSGEEIPAYGCMQVTGTSIQGDRTYFTVEQPVDEDGTAGPFLWNLHRPIPIGKYGTGDFGPEVLSLSASNTALAGTRFSPTVGSWSIQANPQGSIVQCGSSAMLANVARVTITSEPVNSPPLIRFRTTARSVNREVAGVVDQTFGSSGVAAGDVVTLSDPNVLWGNIEPDAYGFAYRRVADPDADPTIPSRWEIMTCSLPVNEVEGVLTDCLYKFTATATATISAADWIRSTYPNVDDAPEIVRSGDVTIEFANNLKLDAPDGAKVYLKRIANIIPSDPGNTVVPKVRSVTVVKWEAVAVSEQIARWAKFTYIEGAESLPSGATLSSYWDGGEPCVSELEWQISDPGCLSTGDEILACYKPETNKYIPVSTSSALLGPADDITIPHSLAFSGCSLSFTNQPAKVFFCDAPSSAGLINPTLTSQTVLTSIALTEAGLVAQASTVSVCFAAPTTEITIPITECVASCSGSVAVYTWDGTDWNLTTPCPGDAESCASTPPAAPGSVIGETSERNCVVL